MSSDNQIQDNRSMRERMLAGDLYIANDPLLEQESKRAILLSKQFADAYVNDQSAAHLILKELLGSIADDAHIRPPIFVDYGKYISVGTGTFINFGLTALDVAPINIGNDVQVGPNVQLLTPTHPVDSALRKAKWEAAKPITIGDNVWIGGGAIILAGVSIGENSVIGAGAVVTKDVPPNVVAVGNPARVIKQID